MSKTEIYTIKSGSHSSGFRISPFIGRITDIQKRISFSKCDYKFEDQDQQDWNKLFGFNFGFKHKYIKNKGWISKSKIEFGWRYNYIKDCITIGWFVHIDYEQHYGELLNIPLCTEFIYRLVKEEDTYHFLIYDKYSSKLNSNILASDYIHLRGLSYGYKLYPWFGGDKTAQNDVVILSKDIKDL